MRKNILHYTLRGLPELELFPTDELRQKALHEIGTQAGRPDRGSFWFAVGILVAATLGGLLVPRWLLSYVLWPRLVEEVIRMAGMFLAFGLTLRWLHRSGTARELREKLLECGVPVCLPCGYLLRGLTARHERCPECGTTFSGRVRELLPESCADSPPPQSRSL